MVNFLGGGSASLNTFKMYPLSNILDTKEYLIGKLEVNTEYDPEYDFPSDSLISLEDYSLAHFPFKQIIPDRIISGVLLQCQKQIVNYYVKKFVKESQ